MLNRRSFVGAATSLLGFLGFNKESNAEFKIINPDNLPVVRFDKEGYVPDELLHELFDNIKWEQNEKQTYFKKCINVWVNESDKIKILLFSPVYGELLLVLDAVKCDKCVSYSFLRTGKTISDEITNRAKQMGFSSKEKWGLI